MLDSSDTGFAALQHGATGSFYDILGKRVDNRRVGNINAAELVTVTGSGRTERCLNLKARMKAFPLYRERSFQGELLHAIFKKTITRCC